MSKSYIDDAAQPKVEKDKDWAAFKVRRESEEPDFELLSGRWALITPKLILDAKKYTRLKNAVKKLKRGTSIYYDEKLGMVVVPKIRGTVCCVETILDNQPYKQIPIEDNMIAIVDNSEIGSGRNPNAVRFTTPKDVAGYVVNRANGKVSIEIWGEGYGRNLVDAYCG